MTDRGSFAGTGPTRRVPPAADASRTRSYTRVVNPDGTPSSGNPCVPRKLQIEAPRQGLFDHLFPMLVASADSFNVFLGENRRCDDPDLATVLDDLVEASAGRSKGITGEVSRRPPIEDTLAQTGDIEINK